MATLGSSGSAKKENPLIGFVVLVGIGFAVFSFGKGCSGSEEKTASSPAPTSSGAAIAVNVTAYKLAQDYEANELAADNKYKGKALSIVGSLVSINRDFLDKPYLMLRAPNEFMGVHADLRESQATLAAGLSRGQRVSLVCEGNGMIVGSPMLKDCVIE